MWNSIYHKGHSRAATKKSDATTKRTKERKTFLQDSMPSPLSDLRITMLDILLSLRKLRGNSKLLNQ
jgi:hypothetical protein